MIAKIELGSAVIEHARTDRPDLPVELVAVALELVAVTVEDVEVLDGAVLPLHAAVEQCGALEIGPEMEREVASVRQDLNAYVALPGPTMRGQAEAWPQVVDDANARLS